MAKKGTERKPYRRNLSRTVLKRLSSQVIVRENVTHYHVYAYADGLESSGIVFTRAR
jgi:hypothetical protein